MNPKSLTKTEICPQKDKFRKRYQGEQLPTAVNTSHWLLVVLLALDKWGEVWYNRRRVKEGVFRSLQESYHGHPAVDLSLPALSV